MLTYFGYGSNINLVSLKAKGVEPISSTRGILHGRRLRFNVQHWFRHEGGVGNTALSDDPRDTVEGMVHLIRDEHLALLDAVEAYGKGYDRIEVQIETEVGSVKALTYIGLPEYINDSCLPTQRYLNIIIQGAEAAGLSQPYIDRLRQHPIHIADEYPDFEYPSDTETLYNAKTLATHPHLTALGGAVFDMSGRRRQLECLGDLFGGKDMTLFHLRRLDTSDGSETITDILTRTMSAYAKQYLNAYLHEYAREFKYAGRYDYSES